MLIQIPVFFGFLSMLRTAIELRGAHFLWACDLAQPDTLAYIGSFRLNLFPLLMGGAMLWQAQLTPMSPGMDPSQQKMMRYLPLVFLFGFYNSAAGLTIYWLVNTLLSILQTKMTKTLDATVAPAPVVPARKKK